MTDPAAPDTNAMETSLEAAVTPPDATPDPTPASPDPDWQREDSVAGKITRGEILHLVGPNKDNRLAEYPLTSDLERNLAKLLTALNALRLAYGRPMIVQSGYRPGVYNDRTPGAAPHSLHKVCAACDFQDPAGEIKKWCYTNVPTLKKLGLQMESALDTGGMDSGWAHLDIGTRPATIFRK